MRRFLPDLTTCAAACSGLLMALSFPRPDIAALAWFGLVPLLLVMCRRPFKSGFVAGLVFFAVVLYWLNIVMTTYGQLHPLLSVVAWLLLSTYLALFFAAATWAACRLKEKKDYPYAMTLPVLWVGLEFLREFLLTGFPWATLGYSQQSWLAVIQSADLFGVYGLSFLLVLSNAVLAEVLVALRSAKKAPFPLKALLVSLLLVGANLGYGVWKLGTELDDRPDTLKAAVIQGNIDQHLKWHPDNQQNTVTLYRDLSLRAEQAGAHDLLIWPEAATPFYFQDGGPLADQVISLTEETHASLLFGSPAYKSVPGGLKYLNSAFLFSAEGRLLGRSDKVHLVPFGEYVPLAQFLPFIDKLVVGIGDFSPGEVVPLPMNGHHAGVLVCYEAIFPELAREYVRSGSDLLINITNDAWFGRSSAPYQHLAMTRFRAIENRVWLARAANTGISTFISPAGRVIDPSELFEPGYVVAEIGVGARPGLYTEMGDVLPGLFLVIGLAWLVQTRRRML